MKTYFQFILIILISISIISCGGSSSGSSNGGGDDDNSSATWTSDDVDKSGNVGIDPAIALDGAGNVHICYYDQTNKDLKYATNTSGSWVKETVISSGDVGEECGIAIDSDDNPHISSNNGSTTNTLRYATKTSGSWDVKSFDQPENYHVQSTSIAIDGRDYPHIVYNIQENEGEDPDEDMDHFRHQYWDGDDWQSEIIYERAQDVFLAIDSDNNLHVSFRYEDPDGESNEYRLTYAKRENGNWTISTVDNSHNVGGDTGIAVDSADHPHIVYRDYENGTVRYAYHNGTKWSTEVVDDEGGDNEGTKIAVDSDNHPHIIYSCDDDETLKYAVNGGSDWTIENVDQMGNPAIAVDSSGIPHVAHNHTWDNEDDEEYLKYSVRE